MLLSGPAVICQDGIHYGGFVAVVEGVSWRRGLIGLGSAPMSPSGIRWSDPVWVVVACAPVCPSSTSVSYFGQSCNIRSTYVTFGYGWTRVPPGCEHGRGACSASIVGVLV